jgi:hypothetical protein
MLTVNTGHHIRQRRKALCRNNVPTVIAAAPTMGRFFCPRLPGVNDALTFVHNHFTDAVDFVGHFGPAEIL